MCKLMHTHGLQGSQADQINRKDEDGRTALHWAASNKQKAGKQSQIDTEMQIVSWTQGNKETSDFLMTCALFKTLG
jgi:ankyrin repeat protein